MIINSLRELYNLLKAFWPRLKVIPPLGDSWSPCSTPPEVTETGSILPFAFYESLIPSCSPRGLQSLDTPLRLLVLSSCGHSTRAATSAGRRGGRKAGTGHRLGPPALPMVGRPTAHGCTQARPLSTPGLQPERVPGSKFFLTCFQKNPQS